MAKKSKGEKLFLFTREDEIHMRIAMRNAVAFMNRYDAGKPTKLEIVDSRYYAHGVDNPVDKVIENAKARATVAPLMLTKKTKQKYGNKN